MSENLVKPLQQTLQTEAGAKHLTVVSASTNCKVYNTDLEIGVSFTIPGQRPVFTFVGALAIAP